MTPHATGPSVFLAARKRAAGSSFFLAHDLDEYERLVGLSDSDLAQALGCSLDVLDLLGLCRTPSRDARFRADLEAIGTRFQIDAVRLAVLLRVLDALRAFEPLAQADGWLAAARDREDGLDDQR